MNFRNLNNNTAFLQKHIILLRPSSILHQYHGHRDHVQYRQLLQLVQLLIIVTRFTFDNNHYV